MTLGRGTVHPLPSRCAERASVRTPSVLLRSERSCRCPERPSVRTPRPSGASASSGGETSGASRGTRRRGRASPTSTSRRATPARTSGCGSSACYARATGSMPTRTPLRAWRAGNRDVVFPYGTNKDAKGPPRPRRPPPRLNRLHSSPARQGPALPRAPVRRPPPDGRPKRPLGRSPPPPRALNRAAAAPPPPHSRRLRRETLGPDCLLNPRRL
jgi:hypothetical protein